MDYLIDKDGNIAHFQNGECDQAPEPVALSD